MFLHDLIPYTYFLADKFARITVKFAKLIFLGAQKFPIQREHENKFARKYLVCAKMRKYFSRKNQYEQGSSVYSDQSLS